MLSVGEFSSFAQPVAQSTWIVHPVLGMKSAIKLSRAASRVSAFWSDMKAVNVNEDNFSLTIRICCLSLSITSAEKFFPNPSIDPVLSVSSVFGSCFIETHNSQALVTSSTMRM